MPSLSVADLGEGHALPCPPTPLLFWVKKKKWQKGEKPAGQVNQNRFILKLLVQLLPELIALHSVQLLLRTGLHSVLQCSSIINFRSA